MHFPVLGDFYQRLLFLLPFAAQTFDYDNPNLWYVEYPTCLGYRQSPIAISTHKTIPIGLPPILFGLYDIHLAEQLTVRNNGHTVDFSVPTTILGEKPFIIGGLLSDVYEAEGVHFHWGSPATKGSEHVLNGRRYDLEMHIVHRNTKYLDVPTAKGYPDGLAVLAVLFKVVRAPMPYMPGLSEVFETLLHVTDFNSTYTPPALITLGSLLGHIDRENFFTYKGSLTTPPCSEAVTWIVFPEVLPISHLELPKFWLLRDKRDQPLLNNYRPLQASKYREVFHRQSPLNYAYLQA